MTDLFREEVVSSRRQKWLGDILLVRPVSLSVLTLIAVAITPEGLRRVEFPSHSERVL